MASWKTPKRENTIIVRACVRACVRAFGYPCTADNRLDGFSFSYRQGNSFHSAVSLQICFEVFLRFPSAHNCYELLCAYLWLLFRSHKNLRNSEMLEPPYIYIYISFFLFFYITGFSHFDFQSVIVHVTHCLED